ncbi:hypothetical protein L289_1992 [Acinetobacter gerneri DSM 14967 = CIP 107464 = MTCC 9824]|nr:hypothetical protein L289_1992 [Acinetobacter gerneri DSM 14967 = CIP 107464 = MTCC 9824]
MFENDHFFQYKKSIHFQLSFLYTMPALIDDKINKKPV